MRPEFGRILRYSTFGAKKNNLETAFQAFLEENSTIVWKIPANMSHPARVQSLAMAMEKGRLGFRVTRVQGPRTYSIVMAPLPQFRSYNAFLPYGQESTQPGALRSFCWRHRLFPSVGFISLNSIGHLFCWLRTFVSCYSLSSPTSYFSSDNISTLSLSLLQDLFTLYDSYNTHCSDGLHKRQYTLPLGQSLKGSHLDSASTW